MNTLCTSLASMTGPLDLVTSFALGIGCLVAVALAFVAHRVGAKRGRGLAAISAVFALASVLVGVLGVAESEAFTPPVFSRNPLYAPNALTPSRAPAGDWTGAVLHRPAHPHGAAKTSAPVPVPSRDDLQKAVREQEHAALPRPIRA